MLHRITCAALAMSLTGCVPPMMAMAPGVTQAASSPNRPGCGLWSGYGGGAVQPGAPAGNTGGFSYAMSQGMRALQSFGGCAPAGTTQQASSAHGLGSTAPDVTAQLKMLMAQRNVCTEAVRARPEFAAVARHFSPVETGQFSMTQLTDTAHPTASEARLVARYYDASSPCTQALAASLTKLSPVEGAVLDQSIVAQQNVVTQLATRRITWGEFAQASQKISEQEAAKVQTAGL